VGKENEGRLSKSLMNSAESSYQQGVLIGEDSYGVTKHVNEDENNLDTLTIQEVDQIIILIIGGIQVFLPNNQVGARACVAGATIKGKPTRTVKEEENEKILKSDLV
jgi:hypothetical protein